MVELLGDGTYWNINTAGIFKTSYGKNRKEVYNRYTTVKQSTETAEVSQGTELSGTQAPSSIITPTTSSDIKDTTNLPNSNNLGEKITEAEAEVNTSPTEKQKGDMLSTYLDERKSENRNGFYKIRPKQEEQQIKKEDDDTLYRSDDNVLRLNKYAVEEIFGGIWIEDKEEFAKFASAVNNSPFEENGEGVAYTDNYFYAYYLNIGGQVIPFASVYLNSLESQEVVNQVKQEIKNGRKKEGIKQYFDRAFIRARSLRSQDNADNGDNNGLSSPTNDGRLDAGLLRKGRYYDRPSLYVKTQRVDRFGLIEDYSRQGSDSFCICIFKC